MPGEASLIKQQYYGHPRNHFWKLIYTLFATGEIPKSYEEKVQFLLSHHLALWDVLAFCEREGSLDSSIRNETPNDFHSLFLQYPNIRYVLFNGAKAYTSFQRHIGFHEFPYLTFHQLPSTSPANTIGFQKKLQHWMIVKQFCKINKFASTEQ